MATEQQLIEGIRRADAAGDADGVRALGAELLRIRGTAPKPAQKAPPKPAPKPQSRLEQLGSSTANALAGLAQGITSIPDMVTGAIGAGSGYLVQGAGNVAGAVADNMGGNGNAIRATSNRYAEGLKHPVTFGGMVESIAPTPKDTAGQVARFGAQMIGGAISPVNALMPKPVARTQMPVPNTNKAAQEVVAAGRQANVRVMTSDVRPPRTVMAKAAQKAGELIPLAGTSGARRAQNVERIAAVKQVAQDFGVTDDAIDAVAEDLAKTRGGIIKKLTTAKNAVIAAGTQPVPAPKATAAIDQQIANLTGINAEAYAPVIAKLQSFKDMLASGKNLAQIEGNRKLLGEMFADPSLAAIKGDGQKAINAIYAPLRSDMGDFIKATQGPAAFGKWKGANDQLSAMAGDLGNRAFKNVLADAESTPENVAKLLFSKKPSDVSRLMGNLSAAGQVKARAAVIHKALESAGGIKNVSPDRFATAIDELGRSAGVIFQPGERVRLEGLSKLLNATKRAAEAGVLPNNGAQLAPWAVPTAISSLATNLAGGSGMAAAGATTAISGGIGLLARAYESAPVRDLLIKAARAPAGSNAEVALLERAAAAIVAMRPRNPSGAALNDNMAVPLAADPGQQQQQENQRPPQP